MSDRELTTLHSYYPSELDELVRTGKRIRVLHGGSGQRQGR